jgi:hypothetical protein
MSALKSAKFIKYLEFGYEILFKCVDFRVEKVTKSYVQCNVGEPALEMGAKALFLTCEMYQQNRIRSTASFYLTLSDHNSRL